MKIDLRSIPEEGIQHTFFIDEQSFKKIFLEEPQGFLLREARVCCFISRIGDRVYIKGEISAVFVLECARCLTPTAVSANDAFAYIFVPAPKNWGTDVELSSEEMDEVFYDGEVINLTEVIFEQINLLAPFWVLCRDDCQGLCPMCGKNRNESHCSCVVPNKEKQFTSLSGLKID